MKFIDKHNFEVNFNTNKNVTIQNTLLLQKICALDSRILDAVENIPLALAENCGLSPIETVSDVKARQIIEKKPYLGIDCMLKGTNGKF